MDTHHTQEHQGARSYSVVAPGRCRRTAVREMTAGSVAGVSTGYQNNRFFQWFDERMRTGWDGSFPTQHTGRHIARDPRFKGLSLIAFLDDAPRRVTGAALFAEAASGSAAVVLRQAIERFKAPATIPSDSGVVFCRCPQRRAERALAAYRV